MSVCENSSGLLPAVLKLCLKAVQGVHSIKRRHGGQLQSIQLPDNIIVLYRIKEGQLLQIHLIRFWNCLVLGNIGADLGDLFGF